MIYERDFTLRNISLLCTFKPTVGGFEIATLSEISTTQFVPSNLTATINNKQIIRTKCEVNISHENTTVVVWICGGV